MYRNIFIIYKFWIALIDKKLISDMANMWKRPIVIIHIDATNYYNRVAYLFASLYAQYFGLEVSNLLVLFRTMQMMRIFLCASFGTSGNFYSRGNRILFQGVVQGNRVVLLL